MDRNGENSGTPDSYHGDEGIATKHNLRAQNQATRQHFQRLEARLDDTFDEFRHQHEATQASLAEMRQDRARHETILSTMGRQLAQLLICTNDRHSNSQSASRSNRSQDPYDANPHAHRRSASRPPSVQGSSNHDPSKSFALRVTK